jgi:hypothetical protein
MQPRSRASFVFTRAFTQFFFRPQTGCFAVLALLLAGGALSAQSQGMSTNSGAAANRAVPNLVRFSGTAKDSNGKPLTGVAGITFALYANEQGGAVLWMETQNVQADASGHYTVSLGANKPLPVEVFSSGEARWLGVQVSGQAEQNRILLLSVPYALKAADAETVGGFSPSAFVLAAIPTIGGSGNSVAPERAAITPAATVGGTGTTNFLPLWTNSTTLGNSALFQTGGKVGIGTITPAATLDVKGAATVRGNLLLPALGAATAVKGSNSNPGSFQASSFNSGTKAAVNQTFQLQAEPLGNNTTTPSGTLNLLFGSGTAAPAETGLKISSKGLFTFAPGQTFPGTGNGTVTSVALAAPSSDFTVSGSPITGAGTLNLGWTVAPDPGNTPNAIVKRDNTGSFTANALTANQVFANAVVASTSLDAPTITSSGTVTVNTANSNPVVAQSSAITALAILGYASATSGPGTGVYGETNSSDALATGILGVASATTGFAQAVNGISLSPSGLGVVGQGGSVNLSTTGANFGGNSIGTLGDSALVGGIGALGTADDGVALEAANKSARTTAIFLSLGTGNILQGVANGGSVRMDNNGTVHATGGFVTGSAVQSRMDHPLDPSGKYLYHASIESSEMLNLYTGNTVLDADGSAAVSLPDWFTALNEDFRYQLTPIGGFAQLYIAEKITGNQFRIAGGRAGLEVSWLVTGVRRDAYAKMHPLVVESDKQGEERGHYLHPDAFGQPLEMGITAVERAKLHPPHAAKPAAAPVSLKGLGATKLAGRKISN